MKRFLGLFFLFFIFIIPAFCNDVIAIEKITQNIAVVDFSGKNVSALDSSIFSDFLRTCLVKTNKYSVLEKSNMEDILNEITFQQTGLTDSQYAVKIGKMLNVQKVVLGTISKLKNSFYVTSNFVDVETAKIEMSEMATCKKTSDFPVIAQRFSDKFVKKESENINNIGIVLGYPYLGLKYNFSARASLEAKYATGEGINVYAGRFYWNFFNPKNLRLFTGLEGGYINFDTLDIKGIGSEGSIFIGGEYFISKKLSLALDFDPTFIRLKSNGMKVDGIEWVMNIAVYFYIF